MGGTIAVVFKEEGGNRKETRWFNHAHDAERHIEGLLEAGFERGSIRVLEGRDMDVLITQKPVVSLLPAVSASMPTQNRAGDLGPVIEHVPVAADVSGEPYTQEGVRFS